MTSIIGQLKKLLYVFLDGELSENEERLKYWWEHQDELKEKLQKLLLNNKEASASTAIVSAFKLWRTVKLGVHKSIDAYRAALKKAKMEVGTWASGIMGKSACTVSAEKCEVDLVVASGHDLGFTKPATRKDIYEKAKSMGLELCPAEVGPALRLSYKDQPKDEYLLIGMEPIAGSGSSLEVFLVGRGGDGRWLGGGCGYPAGVWGPGDRWVFVLPRK